MTKVRFPLPGSEIKLSDLVIPTVYSTEGAQLLEDLMSLIHSVWGFKLDPGTLESLSLTASTQGRQFELTHTDTKGGACEIFGEGTESAPLTHLNITPELPLKDWIPATSVEGFAPEIRPPSVGQVEPVKGTTLEKLCSLLFEQDSLNQTLVMQVSISVRFDDPRFRVEVEHDKGVVSSSLYMEVPNGQS